MSETGSRIALVAGAILVTLVVTLILRARATGPARKISAIDLAPGVYYFSSATCAECAPARRMLIERFGEGGFSEMSWEQEPGLFHSLGIDAVPATLVVGSRGSGTLWPGKPNQMFSRFDP